VNANVLIGIFKGIISGEELVKMALFNIYYVSIKAINICSYLSTRDKTDTLFVFAITL